MRYTNKIVLNAVTNDGNKTSSAIDASQLFAASVIGVFSDGAAAGTIKIQGSNDTNEDSNLQSVRNFTPTNWVDIPSASGAVTAGEVEVAVANPLCYRWIRATWTRTAGAGTIIFYLQTQGV